MLFLIMRNSTLQLIEDRMKPANFPANKQARQVGAMNRFALRSQKPDEDDKQYKAYLKRVKEAHENTIAAVMAINDPRSVRTKKRRVAKGHK